MKMNRADQILSAAETCVMQKGFHNTTVQEIAVMAGISTGLIYRYFKGKSDIIEALVNKVVQRLQQKMKADSVLEGDSARLTLFAGDTVNADTRDSIALMLAISAEASRNAHVQHIIHRAHLTLQDYAFSHFRALNANAKDSEIRTRLYIFSLIIDGVIMRKNVNIAQHNAAFWPLVDDLIRQMNSGV